MRLKSKWQRISTINFYLRDISTPLVGVVFRHIDQIQEIHYQGKPDIKAEKLGSH